MKKIACSSLCWIMATLSAVPEECITRHKKAGGLYEM